MVADTPFNAIPALSHQDIVGSLFTKGLAAHATNRASWKAWGGEERVVPRTRAVFIRGTVVTG